MSRCSSSIAPAAVELDAALAGAAGTDVTGGMRHRVESALRLAEAGVGSLIANGWRQGLLRDVVLDYQVPGTRIAPVAPGATGAR